MVAGGQGKVQGNSCMAQCMGVNAEFFDAGNELTQFCQGQCNVGTGAGACLTSADGCCVPFTGDPDCGSVCPCFNAGDIDNAELTFGTGTLSRSKNYPGPDSELICDVAFPQFPFAASFETILTGNRCFSDLTGPIDFISDVEVSSCETLILNECG